MAGLGAVFTMIQTNMVARQSGLTFYVGAKNLDRNFPGNSVVFVPTQDAFDAAIQQNMPDYRRPTGVVGAPVARTQRVIRVKRAGFKVMLYGVKTSRTDTRLLDVTMPSDSIGDRDAMAQVETMLDTLINAMHEAMSGPNLMINSGQWMDNEGKSTAEYGLAYVLDASVAIPVIFEESTVAHPTSISTTLTVR